MARYPIKQPPEGYAVVFDTSTKRYYPLKKSSGRGQAGPGWDYINERDPDGVNHHVSYAKRADAVRLCVRMKERDRERGGDKP